MKTYTITQEQIDATKAENRRVIFPGVTGPGEYTYSERDNLYLPIAAAPTSDEASQDSGIIGIGGIGIYAENEMPYIPSVASIERYNRRVRQATVCRRCGASSLDGAMFTTIAGGDICDDCM